MNYIFVTIYTSIFTRMTVTSIFNLSGISLSDIIFCNIDLIMSDIYEYLSSKGHIIFFNNTKIINITFFNIK